MGKKPKVLHVGKFYHPFRGGIETYVRLLCTGLSDRVDSSVIVANQGRETRDELIDGIPVSRLGAFWRFGSVTVCPGMVRRIRESNADIVHFHYPNPAAMLAYLASGHRGRLVITYHCDIVRHHWLAYPFRPAFHRLLTRADAIIISTRRFLGYSEIPKSFRDRCSIIPFGVPTKPFEPQETGIVSELRARYGPRVVLATGRLVYYKGFKHLIRAMRDVNASLVIVGEGPMRAALAREIEKAGVQSRVDMPGFVENLTPYYRAADVFVLPSTGRTEAFGLVQLEAMSCGLPVINTSITTGVSSVSLHGLTGLTVSPGEPAALASALNLLLNDEGLRAQYGHAAACRARAEFSLEQMLSKTYGLYCSVLGAQSSTQQATLRDVAAN